MNIINVIYDLYNEVYNWLIILFRGEGADCIFNPIFDLVFIIGAFLGILAGILMLCALCVPFNKVMNLAVGIIGLIWSIKLIEGSTQDVWAGVIAAFILSIYSIIIASPFCWSEETFETSYYLVLGTLFSETKTEGGIKALSIFALFDVLLVTWLGSHIITNMIGYRISGIICLVLYSVLLLLNVISGIRYFKNEWI